MVLSLLHIKIQHDQAQAPAQGQSYDYLGIVNSSSKQSYKKTLSTPNQKSLSRRLINSFRSNSSNDDEHYSSYSQNDTIFLLCLVKNKNHH